MNDNVSVVHRPNSKPPNSGELKMANRTEDMELKQPSGYQRAVNVLF
ncbi:hypothetical protein SRS16CHR_02591 [Variovorax sp. SRS16]|nr:hypothetical protein SRS16CHR_02591 [Variovorax sp. SRS16]